MAPEIERTPIEIIMAETIVGLWELVRGEIDSEKSGTAADMVDKAVAALTKIGAEKEQELIDAQVKNKELVDKVSSLEQKLNSYKRYALTTQIEMVKGNIMIRTTKGPKDVSEYICSTVAKSGALKPSPASFFIQQMSTDTPNKDKTPKKGAKGDKVVTQTNLYKVHLGGKLKNDLFKGLATTGGTRSSSSQDFQVSHDVPQFLYKQRNLLEKAAFSLRREHKDKEVRTKVTLKGFNLALFVKTKELTDWVNIESEKVSQLRSAKLEAKDGDLTPPGDVESLILSLEKF